MRLHLGLLVLATALWCSWPATVSAQVDYATKYCDVWVEGYSYSTTHRSVDAIGPCQTYVQGLVDWGCPQLGTTNVFTMHLWVMQLIRNFPPQQWYLPTNWQCVGGVAEPR